MCVCVCVCERERERERERDRETERETERERERERRRGEYSSETLQDHSTPKYTLNTGATIQSSIARVSTVPYYGQFKGTMQAV